MNAQLEAAYNAVTDVTDSLSIRFEAKIESDHFLLYANGVTLKNHNDDIRLEFKVNDGGGCTFRAVFDRIKPTRRVLKLINAFNEDCLFFNAFIRTDRKNRFLTIRHFTIWDDADQLASFARETVSRFVDLSDDKIFRKLTKYTK